MRVKVLVLLVLAALVLTSCGTPAPTAQTAPTTAPASGGQATAVVPAATQVVATKAPQAKVLKVALSSLESSGWALEGDDSAVLTRAGVIEGLLKVDMDGNVIPWLATSWTRVDDTTWSFKLKTGVSFHNGEAFNAAAVVTALKYILGVSVLPRGFTTKTIASYEAQGDSTLVIKTPTSDPLLPLRFAQTSLGILAPSAYKPTGNPNIVGTGTGPFIITKYTPGQTVSLVKNAKYWGGTVNIDQVELLNVPDPNVRAGMVQSGEVSIARAVPIPSVATLSKDKNVTVVRRADPRTVTLYMNNETGPLKDPKVRQAVSYAIDRQAIVNSVLEGIGTAAQGPFVTGEPWKNPDVKGYEFNVDKAKALLAEAGYPAGKLQLRLWTYPMRSEFPPMAVAIQSMLTKAGIVVEVRLAEWVTLQTDVVAGNYDMLIYSRGHLVDLVDPEAFFTADYTCKGTNNFSHYCNPTVDAMVEQLRPLADAAARNAAIMKIEKVLFDDAASDWINYSDSVDAISAKVKNYKIHLLGYYQLTPELDIVQ